MLIKKKKLKFKRFLVVLIYLNPPSVTYSWYLSSYVLVKLMEIPFLARGNWRYKAKTLVELGLPVQRRLLFPLRGRKETQSANDSNS